MRFIDAYFTNNERTVVSILWENDKKEVVEETVMAEANEPGWENLLNQPEVTIDKLHERTVNRYREQREIYEQQVMEIARRDGLIYDLNNIDSQLYEVLAKCLFKEYNYSEDKEKLFMFKLQLFELDFIKECTDNNLKRDLRKAANFIDATQIAINIKNSS